MLFEDEAASGDRSTYMSLIAFPAEGSSASDVAAYGAALLNALYGAEIEKRLEMGVYKTAKLAPVALDVALVDKAKETIISNKVDECDPCRRVGWEQSPFAVDDLVLTFLVLPSSSHLILLGVY